MTELCPVCQLRPIATTGYGLGHAKTCGASCSIIRNTVYSDEDARKKWLKLNANREAWDKFLYKKSL